jgi:hypothetical protein
MPLVVGIEVPASVTGDRQRALRSSTSERTPNLFSAGVFLAFPVLALIGIRKEPSKAHRVIGHVEIDGVPDTNRNDERHEYGNVLATNCESGKAAEPGADWST